RAVGLFEEAHRRGEPRASERLGLLAARGDIVLDDTLTYDRLLVASLRQSDSATLELARLQVSGGHGVPQNLIGAIASLEDLAEAKDPSAMLDLARIYTQPELGHLNYPRAESLLKDAQARGRPEAALELARLYARADTPLANPQQARSWAETAASRGLPQAWLVIGSLSADPAGLGYDPAAAEAAFQRAIDAGIPEGRLGLAKLQQSTGRTEQALATYRQLIAEGMVELNYEAGAILDDSYPTRRGEAYAYLEAAHRAGREAAPLRLLNLLEDHVPDPDGDRRPAIAIVTAWADSIGDPTIHYRLGRMFEDGVGDLADRQQAIRYFALAGDGGNGEGALRAARLLSQGGGTASGGGAADYYRRAASLGQSGALVELARYQEATGQVAAAAASFAAAVNAGQPDAAVRLARLAEDNPGVVDGQSTQAALERAVQSGNPDAMVSLGDVLLAAGGAEAEARALDLFRQSAEQGNAGAMRRLGDLAEDGVGGMTERDAAAYFERALLAGDGRSAYRLLRNAARHGSGPSAYERALDFATPAAQAGDPLVAYWYGVVLIKLNRPEEAADWLLAAHSQGVAGALEELLSLAAGNPQVDDYLHGSIEQAALTGDACDRGRLALIRADEATSSAEAPALYQEALQAGWYVAADRLGRLYMTGLGSGAPDLPMAYAYLQVASEAGIARASESASDLATAMSESELAAGTQQQAELKRSLPTPCSD
ncbi:MAG: hypothetical protein ACFCVH_23045, partial [Alphaproteobacteria bacterium]